MSYPTLSATELTDAQWLTRLASAHNVEIPELERYDAYYEGEQPLSYMHPELLRRVDSRVRQVVVNWPALVVDALDERLDVTGFRLGGDDEGDEDLWRIWQRNNLDEAAQQAHIDALALRRSFVIVGTDPANASTPLVTVESPLDVHVELDPATRQVRAALKRWWDGGPFANTTQHAALYLPNYTVWFEFAPDGGWGEVRRDEHELGVVPVVPILNRPRIRRRAVRGGLGKSELASVIPLSDAACKIATDMMVSAEFHAMPRRYALGFDKDDFVDATGKALTPWEAVAGVVWASAKSPKEDGVAVGQFPESNLTNFHDTLNALARLVSSLSGLPPHYLGYATDNPASADAIRSSEARHIKRAERKQRAFGAAWEQVMRLVLLVRDGKIPEQAHRMETLWADAATPTFAAKADAVTKLYAADRLLPRRAARRALGYSDTEIRDMDTEDTDTMTRIMADPAVEYGPKPATTEPGPLMRG